MAVHLPFRHRAKEMSRIEAFSDVVFGFALTLIVISLEVPSTFAELRTAMRGIFGFAICFAILMWIWHAHHTFFKRYALDDGFTIVLNLALLFLVLFYVYPLKFMFGVVTGSVPLNTAIAYSDVPALFLIYSGGFCGLFLILFLMYHHAWRKRDELELNEVERIDTRMSMALYGADVLIGVASVLIALLASGFWVTFAGYIYFLLGPVSGSIGYVMGRRRDRAALALRGLGPNATNAMS